MLRHRHHIIPKHIGGTNDPSNIIVLTIEEHAKAHKKLWEDCGRWQDFVAWKMLSGQMTNAEANHIIFTRPKSEEHKKKQSLSMIGRKYSEKHKQKLSLAKIGNQIRKGKKYGPQKNPALIRKKRTPEHAAHISRILLGRKRGHWWNNGSIQTIAFYPPDNTWIRGILKR